MRKTIHNFFYSFLIVFRSLLWICLGFEICIFIILLARRTPVVDPAFCSSTPGYIDSELLLATVADELQIAPTLDACVEAHLIPASEQPYLSTLDYLPRIVVWRILLPAYGIYPYPASLYPDFTLDTPVPSQIYLDAWATALSCNLVTVSDSPQQYMTVSEFDCLISALTSNLTVPVPSLPDCPYITADTIWTLETFPGRNSLLAAWNDLPSSWRADFINRQWKVDFTIPEVLHTDHGDISRDQAAGAIFYQNQIIYLDTASPATSFHEFGHYVAYRCGWWDEFLNPYFATESAFTASILGDYSQTSPREYLAEFIECWFIHPDSRDILFSLAPETTLLVINLIDHFPEIVSNNSA